MLLSRTLSGHAALLLVGLLVVLSSGVEFRCGRQGSGGDQRPPKFHFAGACVRSKMTLVAAAYSSSLKNCAQFAHRRRGLAINFINRNLLYPSAQNYSRETCLVFDCPEFDVQMSLEIDSLFDYYSTYARPMQLPQVYNMAFISEKVKKWSRHVFSLDPSNVNSLSNIFVEASNNVTCVPRLGVFQVHQKRLNFTDAEDVCEAENGYLADISNGQRSVQLASILLKEHVRAAYIGLAQEEGRFITPEGMLLECLPYRAWAPGQPRPGNKCAALTDKGLWISYDCKKRLPFLCELKQSGPLHPCVNLPKALRWKCRETFTRSFPNSRRQPQCGDPQIDENTFRLQLQVKNDTNTIKTDNEESTKKIKSHRRIPN